MFLLIEYSENAEFIMPCQNLLPKQCIYHIAGKLIKLFAGWKSCPI